MKLLLQSKLTNAHISIVCSCMVMMMMIDRFNWSLTWVGGWWIIRVSYSRTTSIPNASKVSRWKVITLWYSFFHDSLHFTSPLGSTWSITLNSIGSIDCVIGCEILQLQVFYNCRWTLHGVCHSARYCTLSSNTAGWTKGSSDRIRWRYSPIRYISKSSDIYTCSEPGCAQ